MGDTTSIQLVHGAGGAATMRLIQEEILPRFGNPVLSELEDGSWVSDANTTIVVSTDSFIIDPPIFPGGNIGKLAISGTVNDLVASGATPKYITLSLIIVTGFPLLKLRQILDSVADTARFCGVQVVCGDLKVLDIQFDGGIFINTTGIGMPLFPKKKYSISDAKLGDKIIVTGFVGNHGLAVLSAREGLGFEQRVVSDCAPLNKLIIPFLRSFSGVHAMRDPTRGGLINVLADIAQASQAKVIIEQDKIPLQREVAFGCEMLGISPFELVNEGKMVIVISAEQADDALSYLRSDLLSNQSAIIGEIYENSDENTGQIIMRKNGQNIVVHRPEGQAVPRLC